MAQVDYALLAALERMDDEDDFSVSIETLDDIVFHDSDSDEATDKWQSKHTIDQTRSLSDASTDLWKTLANWIAEPGDPKTRLVLLAVASAGPTAALLRAGNDRDVVRARERLDRTALTSDSKANAPYYSAFLGLESEQRRALLERVEIFDGVLPATEVQQSLERAVRKSVKPQRRAALVDRLRGWWHKRAIAHLDEIARGQHDRIGAAELKHLKKPGDVTTAAPRGRSRPAQSMTASSQPRSASASGLRRRRSRVPAELSHEAAGVTWRRPSPLGEPRLRQRPARTTSPRATPRRRR